MTFKPRGIKALEGREPVGAVLSIGIKGPTGAPHQKDRFHILEPMPHQKKIAGRHGERTIEVRDHHPRFGPFNGARPELRKTISCQLVHQSEADAWTYYLKAYQVKGQPHHPRRLPFCVGDGTEARRYMGKVEGEHRFEQIACPHDRCEFRQRPRTGRGLGPAPCKPWGKLLFRVVWQNGNMPTMLLKWTTGSWNSIKNAIGMFEYLHQQARMVLGDGRPYTLGGFKFSMTLGEGTNPEERSRFPVVTFAPEIDPIDFFMGQVDRYERIGSVMGKPALPAPMTLDHETAEQDTLDYLAHMPGVGVEDD